MGMQKRLRLLKTLDGRMEARADRNAAGPGGLFMWQASARCRLPAALCVAWGRARPSGERRSPSVAGHSHAASFLVDLAELLIHFALGEIPDEVLMAHASGMAFVFLLIHLVLLIILACLI